MEGAPSIYGLDHWQCFQKACYIIRNNASKWVLTPFLLPNCIFLRLLLIQSIVGQSNLRQQQPILTLFYNIEGKISYAEWSMKRVFFLSLLMKRAKLLAHDWSSGCLATAYAIEKLMQRKFSITMASHFELVDQLYIQELKEKSESKSTKKAWSTRRTF